MSETTLQWGYTLQYTSGKSNFGIIDFLLRKSLLTNFASISSCPKNTKVLCTAVKGNHSILPTLEKKSKQKNIYF